MRKFLKQVDLFSRPVSLQIKGEAARSTILGSLMSLTILAFLISITYSSSLDLFNRQFPQVVTQSKFTQIPDMLKLDPDTFPISISLQNHKTWINFIDETVYEVTVIFQQTETVFDEEQKKYIPKIIEFRQKAQRCNKTVHFQVPDYEYFLKYLDIQALYCLPSNPVQQLEVGGNLDIGTWSAVQFLVSRCDKDIKNYPEQICKPKEEIDQILSNLYLAVYFPDRKIQTGNSNQIVQVYGRSIYSALSHDSPKEIQFQIKKLDIDVDVGYIYQDFKKQIHMSLDYYREMNINFNNGDLVYLSIEASNNFDKKFFFYDQIQQVLAVIVSMFSTMKLITTIFISPITQNYYYYQFIQDYFSLREDSDLLDKEELEGEAKIKAQINEEENNNSKDITDDNINLKDELNLVQKQSKIFSIKTFPVQTDENEYQNINKKEINIENKEQIVEKVKNTNSASLPPTKEEIFGNLIQKKQRQKNKRIHQQLLARMQIFLGCAQPENTQNHESSLQIISQVEDLGVIGKKLQELEILKHILLDQSQMDAISLIDYEEFIQIQNQLNNINNAKSDETKQELVPVQNSSTTSANTSFANINSFKAVQNNQMLLSLMALKEKQANQLNVHNKLINERILKQIDPSFLKIIQDDDNSDLLSSQLQ